MMLLCPGELMTSRHLNVLSGGELPGVAVSLRAADCSGNDLEKTLQLAPRNFGFLATLAADLSGEGTHA